MWCNAGAPHHSRAGPLSDVNHHRREAWRLAHYSSVFHLRLLPDWDGLTACAEGAAVGLDGAGAVGVVGGDGADDAALAGQQLGMNSW